MNTAAEKTEPWKRTTTVACLGQAQGDVVDTLRELLRSNHGSFAVFQLRDCPDIGVQFAGSSEDLLLFDMPVQVMSGAQMERMANMARFFQVSVPDLVAVAQAPEDHPIVSFQRQYDEEDVELAARLVGAVFSRVFECPNDATVECHLVMPEGAPRVVQ